MLLPLVVALVAGPALGRGDASSLRAAAAQGRLDELRRLLEDGATAVDAAGERDWTALHHAVVAGEADAAALLLERGADPNARGQFDLTPLHWAALQGRAHLVKLLIRRGARWEAKDLWGRTALHEAANPQVVHTLIDLGADVNAVDRWGMTPLQLARTQDVANALLERKADLRLRTRAGLTALELQVSEALQDKGLVILTGRIAGRLRGERGRMEVLLRNQTGRPINGLEAAFQSAACSARPAVPRFDLAPGELVALAVDLERTPGIADGEQPMVALFKASGVEGARLDLVVDTSRGETPADQGLIRLGSGSVRPAPGRWADVAFVVAPALLLAAWLLGRWFLASKKRKAAAPPSSPAGREQGS